MINQNIWIIGFTLKFIGVIFAFFAALFTFLAVHENDKHEKTRLWFSQKWESISQSPWLEMPEQIIENFILTKKNLLHFITNLNYDEKITRIVFLLNIIYLNIGILIHFGFFITIISLTLSFFLLLILDYVVSGPSSRNETIMVVAMMQSLGGFSIGLFLTLLVTIITLVNSYFWISKALNTELILAIILMLGMLPCFILLILAPALLKYELYHKTVLLYEKEKLYIFGISVGISFSLTFFSLWFGKVISPSSQVPQTFQMLTSNVIFDAVTVILTFAILEWSLKKKGLLRIPFAIVFDFIISGILACASLYFGLVLSENQLSLRQVLLVLIGKSSTNNGFEFGPFFWAMHTTFIPIGLYLVVILLAWLAKMLLILTRWFFGKGHEHKNPLALTAALCSLVAVTLTFSGLVIDTFDKYFDKNKDTKETPYIQQK